MRYIYAVCEASFHQHQFTVYIVCSRNCMHRRRTRISEYTAIKPDVYVTANGDTVSSSSYSIKKALRETQTLRAGCSKAEPKIFALPQTPFPGRGTAKI